MKSHDTPFKNRRILIVDDNPSIHDDFRKILAPTQNETEDELHAAEVSLFGASELRDVREPFELTFASQGREALEPAHARQARRSTADCGCRGTPA